MDDTKLTKTTVGCQSDENIFGEVHVHFEVQMALFMQKWPSLGFLTFKRQEGNKKHKNLRELGHTQIG